MSETCSCRGVWRSSTTRSWPPGTIAGRPASHTKWAATGWLWPWTTVAAPSPSRRWGRKAAWPTSTPSPPHSPSRCVWVSDSTRRSSTVASPLPSRPEEQTRHARQEKMPRASEMIRVFAAKTENSRCSLMFLCVTCKSSDPDVGTIAVGKRTEWSSDEWTRGDRRETSRAALKQTGATKSFMNVLWNNMVKTVMSLLSLGGRFDQVWKVLAVRKSYNYE